MSDDLGTFGSATTSTSVDTDSLEGAALIHDGFADFIWATREALTAVVEAGESSDPMAVIGREYLADAAADLVDVEEELRLLAAGLRTAAADYATAESEFSIGSWFLDLVMAGYAYSLGMAAGPLLPLLLFGGGKDMQLLGDPAQPADLSERKELEGLPLWLSTTFSAPGVVDALGSTVGGADDFLLGGMGVGLGGALLFGQQGAGMTGSWLGARALMKGGQSHGMLFETGVDVAKDREWSSTAAEGFEGRTDRIPGAASDSDAQVRIDRIEIPGEPPRFEVYIAGTVTFDPVPRDQAFDLTSNISGVALLPSGAQRAIELAMAQAGITADSMVNFIGYSQGGLMAALLAASGDYNTQSVVTIGAPAGEVDIPSHVSAVMVRHDEDPVTMLGGRPEDEDQLYVRRQVFDENNPVPTDLLLPAHHYEYYESTARLMDASGIEAIAAARDRLSAFTDGATSVTSTTFSATRVPDVVISTIGGDANGGR